MTHEQVGDSELNRAFVSGSQRPLPESLPVALPETPAPRLNVLNVKPQTRAHIDIWVAAGKEAGLFLDEVVPEHPSAVFQLRTEFETPEQFDTLVRAASRLNGQNATNGFSEAK